MSVSFDTNANFHSLITDPATTSGSFVSSGANRLLVACVAWRSDALASVTSVKYNGISLSLLDTQEQSGSTAAIYYLIAPASGSNTFEIIMSTQSFMYTSVTNWNGVHQTTPLGTPVKAGVAGVTEDARNASDVVANGAGIDILTSVDDVPGTVIDGANQIRLISNTAFALFIYSSYEIGTADMQVAWANSISIAHIAVAIMPSATTIINRRSACDSGARIGSRQ